MKGIFKSEDFEIPDEEFEDPRSGLGMNAMNTDVMYCVKIKIRIGSSIEWWKVLIDTGSRLNIVSSNVIPYPQRQKTKCPGVVTASGEIKTTEEAIIDVFVSQYEGIQVHAPLVTGLDCAMYLGTPFLSNFRRHESTYDEKS